MSEERKPLLSDEDMWTKTPIYRMMTANDHGLPCQHEVENGDYVLYSDHMGAMDRYKEELIRWLEAMANECDEVASRSDTTNMAAKYDWQHYAYQKVNAHIKNNQK